MINPIRLDKASGRGEHQYMRNSNGAVNSPPLDAAASILARETYRHLRLMLVTLPALMVLAILVLAVTAQFEGSISAYYLGPIRDIFVGAMVGTAVCLIVYRGSPPFEDYTLNVAGFYAIFVAFVPTGLAESFASLGSAERQEAVGALRISIGAVIAIGTVFVLLERRFGHWTIPSLLQRQATKWVFRVTNVLGIGFLILVIITGFVDDSFQGVHFAASVLFFVSLAAAVASHAWPGPFGGSEPGVAAYRIIFGLMLAGILVGFILFRVGSDYTALVLELWEIGLFCAFWVMEARRTWPAVSAPDAPDSPPDEPVSPPEYRPIPRHSTTAPETTI
ncbi:hypothetical protein AB1046_07670 [Promicromonospora sp. Populi]|uniref:hypothetical protein n=1 Tax=Promicromonospora sp. Populi TaxID=3239420 RepID=UPI0034E1C143